MNYQITQLRDTFVGKRVACAYRRCRPASMYGPRGVLCVEGSACTRLERKKIDELKPPSVANRVPTGAGK